MILPVVLTDLWILSFSITCLWLKRNVTMDIHPALMNA